MQTKKLSILLISTILILTILPLIVAYNGFGFDYYSSPVEYLENQWVLFGIIFIILFGVIFYVLNKSFKNPAVASVIGIGLSLFISMAISQRGLLYNYAGGTLSSWALVIASLIAIAFLLRFAKESFGKTGTISTIILIWLILHSLDPYDVLPSILANSGFLAVYEFIVGFGGLIIFVILAFIFSGKGPMTVKDLSQRIEQARVGRW